MKILLLTWNFPPAVGGIEYMIENLWLGLRRRGHSCRVVTAFAEKASVVDDVHRASRPGLKSFVVYACTKGYSLCRTDVPDVILCGSLAAAPAGWILARLFRRPFALPVYGSDIVHEGRLYQVSTRWLLRRADRVFPISTHTRDLLLKTGVAPSRVEIIHPGVRVELFEHEPKQGAEAVLASCAGRRVLLTVGRLVRRKGVLGFVENVMPELVRRCPDVLLLVVGADATASLIHKAEGMRARIEAAIQRLGLQTHVRLLGQVPDSDLHRLYFRADVFVLPCLDLPGDVEGFGIVFSEAALARTPLVATRVGGIPDAVEDGVTGFLVPAGDYAEMQRKVLQLLEDEVLRKRMADAGAARAGRLFAWDVIVDQYATALSLAGRRASGPGCATTRGG
jgi:phosphatidylinositol alpha-1,6-mannosyltransferase